MDGIGFWDPSGAPKDGSKTNGELLLTLTERTAEATEALARRDDGDEDPDKAAIVEAIDRNAELDRESAEKNAELDREADERNAEMLAEEYAYHSNRAIDSAHEDAQTIWESVDDVYDLLADNHDAQMGELRGIRRSQKATNVALGVIGGTLAAIGITELAQLSEARKLRKITKDMRDIAKAHLDVTNRGLTAIDGKLESSLRNDETAIAQRTEQIGLLSTLVDMGVDKARRDMDLHEDLKHFTAQIAAITVRQIHHLEQTVAGGVAGIIQGQRDMIAIMANPEVRSAEHFFQNGVLAFQAGQYKHAIDNLVKAVGLNFSKMKYHFMLARVYRMSGDTKSAAEALVSAASLSKDPAEKDAVLVELLLLQHGVSDRKGMYKTIFALIRINPERYWNIIASGIGKGINTIGILELIARQDPQNGDIAIILAVEYASVGFIKESTYYFRRFLVSNAKTRSANIRQKINENLGTFEKVLEEVLTAPSGINGDCLLLIAGVLFETKPRDQLSAKCLRQACISSGRLNTLLSARKYDDAYALLKEVFAGNINELLRYGFIPPAILQLIKK